MKEKRHRFVRKVYESSNFKLTVGYFGFCKKRLILYINSSVIRQKGESAENACFKKTKHAKFSEKNPCAYHRVRNVCYFSENLASFVFLKHPFSDSLFCLITDEFQLDP